MSKILFQIELSKSALQKLFGLIHENVYLIVYNNHIKFIEVNSQRNLVGVLPKLPAGILINKEVNQKDWSLSDRTFGILRKDIDIFLKMVVGDGVTIILTSRKVIFLDKSNKRRKGEFALLDLTEQLNPNHPKGKVWLGATRKLLKVVIKDGRLHSEKTLKNGNYVHIKNDERPYYAKKVPSDNVFWEFTFMGDVVQLAERRTTVTKNIIDDVWEYAITEHHDRELPLPKKLNQHYLDSTIKNYVMKSGVQEMFIVYTEHSVGLFCIKNDDELKSISHIKAKRPEPE